jgi:hypothetical protein
VKEDYPVYVKWLSIVDWLMDLSEKYPKSVRFSLSNRIVNRALDIQELIIEAIYVKKRIDLLHSVNRNMEILRSYMQISVNRKYISVKQYEYIGREMNEAGSMIGGWLKSCRE